MSDRPAPPFILRKKSDLFGQMPTGAYFSCRARDQIEAYRKLKRACPDENPLEWEIVGRKR